MRSYIVKLVSNRKHGRGAGHVSWLGGSDLNLNLPVINRVPICWAEYSRRKEAFLFLTYDHARRTVSQLEVWGECFWKYDAVIEPRMDDEKDLEKMPPRYEGHPPNVPLWRIRVINPWAPRHVMYMSHFYYDWKNRSDKRFYETVYTEAHAVEFSWGHAMAICTFCMEQVCKDRPVPLWYMYPEVAT